MDAAALQRLRILDRLGAAIGTAVQELYGQVARSPDAGFHFPTGKEAARQAGYPDDDIAAVPDEVIACFAGVGYHLDAAALSPGDRVLDLGCGAGTDLFLAARRVGAGGHVVGIDMTAEMVAAARSALLRHSVGNANVLQARMPKIPDDAGDTFDAVISNGALNLVPEKEAALRRVHHLLRPGGRLALADIALERPPSAACRANATLWAECLVGALTEDDYRRTLEDVGFGDLQVHSRRDYFAASPSKETRDTARDLGGFAWVISARKQ